MDTEKLLRRALIMLQQGKTDTARAMCRKLITRPERRFDSHHLYGAILLQCAEPEAAAEQFRLALKHPAPKAQLAQAHNNLGLALQAEHHSGDALTAFNQAITLNAADPAFWINRANLHERRQNWSEMAADMRQALQLDPAAEDARIGLAVALRRQGQPEEALTQLEKIPGRQLEWLQEWALLLVLNKCANRLTEQLSDQLPADIWLAVADYLVEQDAGNAAAPLYRNILKREPDHATARHMLAALDGGDSHRAPQPYVRELYERNAPRFEYHLTQTLQYDAPQQLASRLRAHIAEPAQALDLGCGSGLMGQALRAVWPELTVTGVDLSPAMLREAERKNCYRALFESDAEHFLSQQPENSQPLICATDMLIYLGDLQPLLSQISRTLSPHGYYAFTVEEGADGIELTQSGRFRHSRSYIEQALAKNGLEAIEIERFALRLENQQVLNGLMVIARRP